MSGKSNFNWTKGQQSAIDARGSTLLVSAAAGSGKTAVLTNRIIGKIIQDKCEITDFLIVTFTRAAAAEMKNKIVTALRESAAENPSDRHLRRQISRINEAKISTIDSFCVSLIKDNFNILGLPAKMRLMDDAESRVFVNRKVNEVLEEFYAKYDDDAEGIFRRVVETLSGDRDDEGFVEAVSDIYRTVISFPQPEKLLQDINDRLGEETEAYYRDKKGVFETYWGGLLKNEISSRISSALRYMKEAQALCMGDATLEKNYLPALDSDVAFAERIVKILEEGNYNLLLETVALFTPERLKSAAKSESLEEIERIKLLREAFKDCVSTMKTELLVFDEEAVFDQCLTSYKMNSILVDMVKQLLRSMREEKIRRKIMDFSDLGHFAFEALVKDGSFDFESASFEKTPLAEKLTEEFEEIFIDEYQDTNLLQDTLFNAISNGRNLFMVGDLKQSIYRFRGADPSIFRKYKDGFEYYGESTAEKQKIFLSENFRSNGGVLDFVNKLFEATMNRLSPGSYIGEDMLVCTKDEQKILPEIHMFEESPRGEGDKQAEKNAEWEHIAQRIAQFKRQGFEYKDIAVLTRDSSGLLNMKRVLDKYSVPCITESRESLFDKSEILMMLCILNTIDNPRRDIYLIGAMTSPFFAFTSDELYNIKQLYENGKSDCFYTALLHYREKGEDELAQKIERFEEIFAKWRELSSETGVSMLIRTIFNDLSVMSVMKDKSRRENLLSFYDFAQGYESKDMKGLFTFVSYVNDIIENGFSQNVPQESGNSVRLMTMHKSKGLEFPVCFVAGLSKKMNKSDLIGNIIVNKELGIATKHSDVDGIVSYDTILRKMSAISEKNKMLEEELRLLYVAFTRAKKHLVMTATVSHSRSGGAQGVEPVYDIKKAQSHFDLVASVLKYDAAYGDIAVGESVYFDSLAANVELHTASGEELYVKAQNQESLTEVKHICPESLEYEYPHMRFTSIPQKLSVSQLHLGLSDDVQEANEVHAYEAPAFINATASKTPAARGTAMHTFVQFCDYEICAKKGCEYDAQRLLREEFITKEQYEMLDMPKLDKFFTSPLYNKICLSHNVYREMRFNVLVEGERLSERAAGEKILVQGVIDCFFENPDGTYTVVDFKTDHVYSAEILRERHRQQLEFYARAVEDMTGKKVKETIIYSFEMSREIFL